jgi:Zn finger protein HypA/HybF involved in hydrogenase expression
MGITFQQLRDCFTKLEAETPCYDCSMPLLIDEQKVGRCERCWIQFKKEEERKHRLFLEENEDGYYDDLDYNED